MLDMYDFKNTVWLCHSFNGKCFDFTAFVSKLMKPQGPLLNLGVEEWQNEPSSWGGDSAGKKLELQMAVEQVFHMSELDARASDPSRACLPHIRTGS